MTTKYKLSLPCSDYIGFELDFTALAKLHNIQDIQTSASSYPVKSLLEIRFHKF
jgi:hypothetical protein